jgi:xanthine dehydrogenase YagR molybdenum-binding subunit
MPKWPDKRQVIGTKVPRLDGALKVSGKAKYSFDRNLPGTLHGKILRSPHAHCKIAELDLTQAEKMPGVKATTVIKQAGAELFYAGDEIAAVAAETEEQARDAVRAIKVRFEILPHLAVEEESLKRRVAEVEALEKALAEAKQKNDAAAIKKAEDALKPKQNIQEAGDAAKALQEAGVVSEGFYGNVVLGHVCWESHGLVAHWKADDELEVYASTQAVHATANALRQRFNCKVTCQTPFMGGGFGSKFGPDIQGFVAAELAKKAKRPVKLMLERDEEHVAAGNRPSLFGKVKLGAAKDGTVTAFHAETYGSGGHSAQGGHRLPYVYAPANRYIKHRDVPLNAGNQRALRAPGHPQACLVMESAMDDLAEKLGMDRVEFRIKNLPAGGVFTTLKPIYEKQLRLGAERIGWARLNHPRGDKTPGPIKRGVGCGINTWGGAAGQAQATCTIHPDGAVEVAIGSQDLGTGTTTLVPIVAAEILGLQVKDIQGKIGSSAYPQAGGSGGSTSCGGVSLAVAVACMKALDQIFAKAAPQLGAAAADLEAEDGKVYVKATPAKSLTWKQACALLGQQPLTATGDRGEGQGMSSQGVGGAQFADVSVDVETGEVRLNKIVAVADCGLVMNRLLCESQVYGGVIGGLNAALFEERRLDPKTGLQLNPDTEWYKLANHSDIPEIEVHLLDYPERGVIGIGEPPYIPTAAAIANAVANAIGVRVSVIPLTPRRVLDALAK